MSVVDVYGRTHELDPTSLEAIAARLEARSFFLASLQSFRLLLPKAGVATPEEVEEFVADQLRASDLGTFFAGYNFYAMLARRAPDLALAGR